MKQIKITDYGKDNGYGRYCMTIDDGVPANEIKKIGTNYVSDILEAVLFAMTGKEK